MEFLFVFFVSRMPPTEQEDQIPIRLREQMAIETASTGTAPSLTIAAQMVGVAPTTLMHRHIERKNKKEEAKRR